MAKSNAKKRRDFLLRTAKRDVTTSRGNKVAISTHVRKTKTKAEKLKHEQTKHKKRHLQKDYHEGDAFLVYF